MKSIITCIVALLVTTLVSGKDIYVKTFGESTNEVILFLHGGPGYNCASFEATTAQKLANEGYFVIAYDRRGEGRSPDTNARFTFEETFDDLNNIYKEYNIEQATLIGHSFGGIVATLFAKAHPEKVSAIILVGAPVSLQESFITIREKSKIIYERKNDTVNLKYLAMLGNMDTTSIEYSSYCFRHAMQNGFYSPKQPTTEAKEIYATFGTNLILKRNASKMSYEAPQGFWKNENYTTINLTEDLKQLKKDGVKLFGLYGKEDGLYAEQQIADLQELIGTNNLKYLDNCSHSVFIDRQTEFINTVKQWIQ